MNVSGENFILTPKTSQLSFVFDGVSLSNNDGVAEIGFSGESQKSIFLFSGNRIIDPNGKYVYSYDAGIPLNISGDIKGGNTYRYYINNILFGDGLALSNAFTIEKLYIKSSGCLTNVNAKLNCPNIDYSIDFAPTFVASGPITGRITNNSSIGFRVFYSYFSEPGGDLRGAITGDVPAYSGLNFTLNDAAASNVGSSINSIINLRTSLGLISSSISSQRVSGSSLQLSNFRVLRSESLDILPYFSGSGNASKFHWMQYPEQKEQFALDYEANDASGNSAEKMLWVTLEPVSPTTGIHYTGVYTESFFTYFSGHEYCITGQGTSTTGIKPIWQCSGTMPGSGRYSKLPEVKFLDYSKVTGFTFNTDNLFTQDTPEKIPILFSGYSGELGDGASGYFLTEAFQVNIKNYLPQNSSDNTPDGSNTTDWRRITGFEITNAGTGYTKMPAVFAATGFSSNQNTDADWDNTAVGGTGYDVGERRTPFVYKAFKAESLGQYEAAHLTGIPHFQKDGNNYLFSGVEITNPGSGYDSLNRKPDLRFTRGSGDTFGTGSGDNTSGEFLFNESGHLYEFDSHWDVTTGLVSSGVGIRFSEKYMYNNGMYSGYVKLPVDSNNVFVDVHFKNTSSEEAFVSKLKISGENHAISEHLVTGKNLFSIDTGLGYYPPTPSFDGSNFYNINYFGS